MDLYKGPDEYDVRAEHILTTKICYGLKEFGHRFVHDDAFNRKLQWAVLIGFIISLPFYATYQIEKNIKQPFIEIEREYWRKVLEEELYIPEDSEKTKEELIEDAIDTLVH